MSGQVGESRVSLPAGLDPDVTFGRLARSGDDLLDRWDGRVLTRSARVGEAVVVFEAEVTGSGLVVWTRHATALQVALAAARTMVEPIPGGWGDLLAEDPALAAVAAAHPGLHAVRATDPVVALVHSISAQQVNLAWAATTRRRLAERYGDEVRAATTTLRVLDLVRLAGADPEDLRALQLTTAKSRALIALATAVVTGGLDVDGLARADDDVVTAELTRLPGIGPWTAQWYLARVLGRPVVVAGDLAVRKAVGRLYGAPAAPSPAETLALTEHWGECALIAQQLVLYALAAGSLPTT
ncbi:MAG TPA: hypothetical protein VNA12_03320 [Mycobacteriales bacterium]|nr:hypothetical protein [Mycobacteriales bacterium]